VDVGDAFAERVDLVVLEDRSVRRLLARKDDIEDRVQAVFARQDVPEIACGFLPRPYRTPGTRPSRRRRRASLDPRRSRSCTSSLIRSPATAAQSSGASRNSRHGGRGQPCHDLGKAGRGRRALPRAAPGLGCPALRWVRGETRRSKRRISPPYPAPDSVQIATRVSTRTTGSEQLVLAAEDRRDGVVGEDV